MTKPETTKLPEIVCQFQSVRNSNCNVLLRFHYTKEPVSRSLYEVFGDETERNESTGSGVLLAKCLKFIQVCDCWSDSIMRNKRSVIRSPKCCAMKPEAVKQPEVMWCFPKESGVSLPYRKLCGFHTGSGVWLPYRRSLAEIFRDETWNNESCSQLFC